MSNNRKNLELTHHDFVGLFETTSEELTKYCGNLIEQLDFRYEKINGKERDNLLLSILKTIEMEDLAVSGKDRKGIWETGWSENLQKFMKKGHDLSCLVPAYMKSYRIFRFNRDYIRPLNIDFLLNFYTVYRHYFFSKYLSDCKSIYEFGCGTGLNLAIMAELFPKKSLHGLDWTAASKRLIDKISDVYGYNLTGHVFDMFAPYKNFNISNQSAIVTLNSLEQLGKNHEAFIQFVLQQKPAICINFEPLIELYNKNNIIDYLAIRYHKKRNYLYGYLTRLQELESEGKIEILKTQRVCFGILYHEAYSFVMWRPKT